MLGATFDLADRFGWKLINTVSASANPAGKVTNATFEQIAGQITSKCTNGVDGILLHLHGAMVTEDHEDAEGELLLRIRKLIGFEVPIVVTLDLHGNITKAMAELSSAMIAVRTYPHIDYYEIAIKAGELLQRIMKKEVEPLTVIAKRNTLWGFDGILLILN